MTNEEIPKEIEDLAVDIMFKAFNINMNMTTDICCFIDYQAHVSKLSIGVRKSKRMYQVRLYNFNTYLERDSIRIMNAFKDRLDSFIKHGDVKVFDDEET